MTQGMSPLVRAARLGPVVSMGVFVGAAAVLPVVNAPGFLFRAYVGLIPLAAVVGWLALVAAAPALGVWRRVETGIVLSMLCLIPLFVGLRWASEPGDIGGTALVILSGITFD